MSEEVKEPVEAPVEEPKAPEVPAQPEKKHDIKELLEVLDAMKALSVIAAKALKDGKIDLADSMLVMDLGQAMPQLAAAVDNVKMVDDEIKDVDADEAVQLIKKLYEIADETQKARK